MTTPCWWVGEIGFAVFEEKLSHFTRQAVGRWLANQVSLPHEQMVTIRFLETGKTQEVTPNIAHDLIERKVAVLASTPLTRREIWLEERRQRASLSLQNAPKTAEGGEDAHIYSDRQMRDSGVVK